MAAATQSTQLSRQLAQLQTEAKRGRGRASLLYSARDAEAYDLDAIYGVGLNGLAELESADPRFTEFENDLFSEAWKDTDRELKDAATNAAINARIDAFLHLLSAHLLSKAAAKALEFLIRRYKVHVYNVDAVLEAALPFHESALFGRLVQVLELSTSSRMAGAGSVSTPLWQFLLPNQVSGAPLPRSVLVAQCSKDLSVLRFVAEAACKHAAVAARAPAAAEAGDSAPIFSLFLVVSTGVIDLHASASSLPAGGSGGGGTLSDGLLNLLLPTLTKGLKCRGCAEFQACAYLLLVRVAGAVALTREAFEALVNLVAAHADPADCARGLRCQLAIFAHQAARQAPALPGFDEEDATAAGQRQAPPPHQWLQQLRLSRRALRAVSGYRDLPSILASSLSSMSGGYNSEDDGCGQHHHQQWGWVWMRSFLSGAVEEIMAAAAPPPTSAVGDDGENAASAPSLLPAMRAVAAAAAAAVRGLQVDAATDGGSSGAKAAVARCVAPLAAHVVTRAQRLITGDASGARDEGAGIEVGAAPAAALAALSALLSALAATFPRDTNAGVQAALALSPRPSGAPAAASPPAAGKAAGSRPRALSLTSSTHDAAAGSAVLDLRATSPGIDGSSAAAAATASSGSLWRWLDNSLKGSDVVLLSPGVGGAAENGCSKLPASTLAFSIGHASVLVRRQAAAWLMTSALDVSSADPARLGALGDAALVALSDRDAVTVAAGCAAARALLAATDASTSALPRRLCAALATALRVWSAAVPIGSAAAVAADSSAASLDAELNATQQRQSCQALLSILCLLCYCVPQSMAAAAAGDDEGITHAVDRRGADGDGGDDDVRDATASSPALLLLPFLPVRAEAGVVAADLGALRSWATARAAAAAAAGVSAAGGAGASALDWCFISRNHPALSRHAADASAGSEIVAPFPTGDIRSAALFLALSAGSISGSKLYSFLPLFSSAAEGARGCTVSSLLGASVAAEVATAKTASQTVTEACVDAPAWAQLRAVDAACSTALLGTPYGSLAAVLPGRDRCWSAHGLRVVDILPARVLDRAVVAARFALDAAIEYVTQAAEASEVGAKACALAGLIGANAPTSLQAASAASASVSHAGGRKGKPQRARTTSVTAATADASPLMLHGVALAASAAPFVCAVAQLVQRGGWEATFAACRAAAAAAAVHLYSSEPAGASSLRHLGSETSSVVSVLSAPFPGLQDTLALLAVASAAAATAADVSVANPSVDPQRHLYIFDGDTDHATTLAAALRVLFKHNSSRTGRRAAAKLLRSHIMQLASLLARSSKLTSVLLRKPSASASSGATHRCSCLAPSVVASLVSLLSTRELHTASPPYRDDAAAASPLFAALTGYTVAGVDALLAVSPTMAAWRLIEIAVAAPGCNSYARERAADLLVAILPRVQQQQQLQQHGAGTAALAAFLESACICFFSALVSLQSSAGTTALAVSPSLAAVEQPPLSLAGPLISDPAKPDDDGPLRVARAWRRALDALVDAAGPLLQGETANSPMQYCHEPAIEEPSPRSFFDASVLANGHSAAARASLARVVTATLKGAASAVAPAAFSSSSARAQLAAQGSAFRSAARQAMQDEVAGSAGAALCRLLCSRMVCHLAAALPRWSGVSVAMASLLLSLVASASVSSAAQGSPLQLARRSEGPPPLQLPPAAAVATSGAGAPGLSGPSAAERAALLCASCEVAAQAVLGVIRFIAATGPSGGVVASFAAGDEAAECVAERCALHSSSVRSISACASQHQASRPEAVQLSPATHALFLVSLAIGDIVVDATHDALCLAPAANASLSAVQRKPLSTAAATVVNAVVFGLENLPPQVSISSLSINGQLSQPPQAATESLLLPLIACVHAKLVAVAAAVTSPPLASGTAGLPSSAATAAAPAASRALLRALFRVALGRRDTDAGTAVAAAGSNGGGLHRPSLSSTRGTVASVARHTLTRRLHLSPAMLLQFAVDERLAEGPAARPQRSLDRWLGKVTLWVETAHALLLLRSMQQPALATGSAADAVSGAEPQPPPSGLPLLSPLLGVLRALGSAAAAAAVHGGAHDGGDSVALSASADEIIAADAEAADVALHWAESDLASSAEYATLLTLQCCQALLSRFAASAGAAATGPAEPAPVTGADVSCVIDCVRLSSSTQTRAIALDVCGVLATVAPQLTLHRLLPALAQRMAAPARAAGAAASSGSKSAAAASALALQRQPASSLLAREDSFSLATLSRLVEAIVPPLMAHSQQQEAAAGSGGGAAAVSVYGLLQTLASARRSMPTHRAKAVYAAVLLAATKAAAGAAPGASGGGEDVAKRLLPALLLFLVHADLDASAAATSSSPSSSVTDVATYLASRYSHGFQVQAARFLVAAATSFLSAAAGIDGEEEEEAEADETASSAAADAAALRAITAAISVAAGGALLSPPQSFALVAGCMSLALQLAKAFARSALETGLHLALPAAAGDAAEAAAGAADSRHLDLLDAVMQHMQVAFAGYGSSHADALAGATGFGWCSAVEAGFGVLKVVAPLLQPVSVAVMFESITLGDDGDDDDAEGEGQQGEGASLPAPAYLPLALRGAAFVHEVLRDCFPAAPQPPHRLPAADDADGAEEDATAAAFQPLLASCVRRLVAACDRATTYTSGDDLALGSSPLVSVVAALASSFASADIDTYLEALSALLAALERLSTAAGGLLASAPSSRAGVVVAAVPQQQWCGVAAGVVWLCQHLARSVSACDGDVAAVELLPLLPAYAQSVLGIAERAAAVAIRGGSGSVVAAAERLLCAAVLAFDAAVSLLPAFVHSYARRALAVLLSPAVLAATATGVAQPAASSSRSASSAGGPALLPRFFLVRKRLEPDLQAAGSGLASAAASESTASSILRFGFPTAPSSSAAGSTGDAAAVAGTLGLLLPVVHSPSAAAGSGAFACTWPQSLQAPWDPAETQSGDARPPVGAWGTSLAFVARCLGAAPGKAGSAAPPEGLLPPLPPTAKAAALTASASAAAAVEYVHPRACLAEAARAALLRLSTSIQPRLLLPVLAQQPIGRSVAVSVADSPLWQQCVRTGSAASAAACARALHAAVAVAPRRAVKESLPSLTAHVLAMLDYRWQSAPQAAISVLLLLAAGGGAASGDAAAADAASVSSSASVASTAAAAEAHRQLYASERGTSLVEAETLAALCALVLKLNEAQLRGLVLQLLQWADTDAEGIEAEDVGAADAAAGAGGGRGPKFYAFAQVCRRIVALRAIAAVSAALRGLLTPLLPLLLPALTGALRITAVAAPAAPGAGTGTGGSKGASASAVAVGSKRSGPLHAHAKAAGAPRARKLPPAAKRSRRSVCFAGDDDDSHDEEEEEEEEDDDESGSGSVSGSSGNSSGSESGSEDASDSDSTGSEAAAAGASAAPAAAAAVAAASPLLDQVLDALSAPLSAAAPSTTGAAAAAAAASAAAGSAAFRSRHAPALHDEPGAVVPLLFGTGAAGQHEEHVALARARYTAAEPLPHALVPSTRHALRCCALGAVRSLLRHAAAAAADANGTAASAAADSGDASAPAPRASQQQRRRGRELVDSLLRPLVAQLELPLQAQRRGGVPGGGGPDSGGGGAAFGGDRAFVAVYAIPCLGSLAAAAAADVLWRPIASAVCLLTRDGRPRVRLAACLALTELFARGREEALVLIPEVLPSLSALYADEDGDAEVEGAAASLVAALERASGEDLTAYLA